MRERMQNQARRDTQCEKAVRSAVHALGFRYRVHVKPDPTLRREADLVFRCERVAVFVDGCFWHGCPLHHHDPHTHHSWWKSKIERNRARDRETDRLLEERGWLVLRVWEHEDPEEAAERIARAVANRRPRSAPE